MQMHRFLAVLVCFVEVTFGVAGPMPSLTPGVTDYYSGCIDGCVSTIRAAKVSVYVQAKDFVPPAIDQALLEAAKRGLKVEVLFDGAKAGQQKEPPRPRPAPTIPKHNCVMILIVDRAIVITGLFPFSNSAKSRDMEHMLVIQGDELAALYFDNYCEERAKRAQERTEQSADTRPRI